MKNPDEMTALLKGVLQVTLQDPAGHVFPVHIPVVDLPEALMDQLPPEERWRGIDAHLPNRMVILCLN